MSAAKGVTIRPTSQNFRLETSFYSSTTNLPLTAGTGAAASMAEVQADGSLHAVDFSLSPPAPLSSSSSVPAAATIALAAQSCGGVAQPYWSASFASSGLTVGATYLIIFTPPSGASTPTPKIVQYGAGEGDLAVDSGGRTSANAVQFAGQAITASAPVTVPASIGTSTFAGGAVASVTGSVGSVTSGVTVATNNDKAGYSLATAPPTAAAIATAILTDTTSSDEAAAGSLGHLVTTAPGWYAAPPSAASISSTVVSAMAASPVGSVAGAVGSVTAPVTLPSTPPSGYGGSGGSGGSVVLAANGLDNIVVESGINGRQALSLITAMLAGTDSGVGTTSLQFKAAGSAGGTTTRVTFAIDGSGNRTATLNPPT